MHKSNQAIMIFLLFVAAFSIACSSAPTTPTSATVDAVRLQAFAPLPAVITSASNTMTEEKVSLGRMLYYEPRLSKSQEISCNTCHLLDKYGVDGKVTSDGHKGQAGNRNAPTVYNAAGHLAQFWDGRAADVEEQAKGPIMNPIEMAMDSETNVLVVLNSMPEYVAAFKRAFPGEKDPVTYENLAKAIGAFERRLTTPSSWDKFLGGDQNALSSEEKAGFNTYAETGCPTCHAGAYLGGDLYQRLGMTKPWPDNSDPGREKVTRSETDRMVFKVPSLRNITKTGPYYHNGKVATLAQAVSMMAEYQLGRTLTEAQAHSIVTFLGTLTGEVPASYIRQPVLPKSTPRTPKPDIGN